MEQNLVERDVFSQSELLLVKDFLQELGYTFMPEVVTYGERGSGFIAPIFTQGDDKSWDSINTWLCKLIYLKISKHFDIDEIYRINANLLTPIGKQLILAPHIDNETPHTVALFYFSTEKEGVGETYLYEEKYDSSKYDNGLEQLMVKYPNGERLTVAEKIPCIENSVVYFDGLTYHSGSYPVNILKRLCINVNFAGTPKHDNR